MFDFHQDKRRYFQMQYRTAAEYIIPFIAQQRPVIATDRILEIGCAEAGVLRAFRELGCDCTGIELSASRVANAEKFHAEIDAPGQVRFVTRDIYEIDVEHDLGHRFDVIVLKDVIEHIPDQARFIPRLRAFLAPGGVIFFGFPPWQMPFGGHQQVCQSRVLSKLPWFHLLPTPLFQGVLRVFGETRTTRRNLQEIKETGITIGRFERIVRQSGLQITQRTFWLLNPIYKYKFGRGAVKQAGVIARLPGLNNFFTTAVYYVVRAADQPPVS
ncbi:MAG: class I SAM-dependent methyltransferase [Saprospiraceae bacterium]|nr:class I SAM-dependent methyltransferase [Saprospiraceae bacterium]